MDQLLPMWLAFRCGRLREQATDDLRTCYIRVTPAARIAGFIPVVAEQEVVMPRYVK